MKPKTLSNKIKKLSDSSPKTDKLNLRLGIISPSARAKYKNQKEHWIGWLEDYPTGGAYNRKESNRDSEYIYNHIQNISMLFWLCEAIGLSDSLLDKVAKNIISVQPRKRCGVLRATISWEVVKQGLN